MRVVAYSIKNFEKESLAKANQRKHDITLISNALSLDTALYAEGKDAVIVFTNDDLSAPVIDRLAEMGIKYIITRSVGMDHIDLAAAKEKNIRVANISAYSPESIAEFAVTLALALGRQLVPAVEQSRKFNFTADKNLGFNFSGKTVGIIGLGHTGQATAAIYKGFGCHILGYDISPVTKTPHIKLAGLDKLLKESDIISLHIPLTADTYHFIDETTIARMKRGVMLINTSRGGLVNTNDVLKGLNSGQIGYLGIDVYEHDKGLFLSDHHLDKNKDPLLETLMNHRNVIVTPHQAYLTTEALQQIALRIIHNLDQWQKINPSDKAWVA
jgi:D-lactate dehydrogenase